MASQRPPLHIEPAPDPVDRELEPLLSGPFAAAWAAAGPDTPATARAVRARLLERLAASRAATAPMVTARLKRLAAVELDGGARARTLYQAPDDRARRPGEPTRAALIELRPGVCWTAPDAACDREWLVLRGSAQLGDERLRLHDYHVAPAGSAPPVVGTDEGVLLFLRESARTAGRDEAAFTVHDDDAVWPAFAPGIWRRVLWQHGGQAAMLYYAQPGAQVPFHTHGHDEECLMLRGELFLDDVLLQEGDYQLAPAGTGHRVTQTDTGAVIYAHGDVELQFVA